MEQAEVLTGVSEVYDYERNSFPRITGLKFGLGCNSSVDTTSDSVNFTTRHCAAFIGVGFIMNFFYLWCEPFKRRKLQSPITVIVIEVTFLVVFNWHYETG